jgi:hypothetical protein
MSIVNDDPGVQHALAKLSGRSYRGACIFGCQTTRCFDRRNRPRVRLRQRQRCRHSGTAVPGAPGLQHRGRVALAGDTEPLRRGKPAVPVAPCEDSVNGLELVRAVNVCSSDHLDELVAMGAVLIPVNGKRAWLPEMAVCHARAGESSAKMAFRGQEPRAGDGPILRDSGT